ncbi:DUF7878 domain-containing protein [Nocardioides limicola]|uniref:DUF7878 domain-containing protein n=1 Tax=Nocardioides limicola TaxID=2803368 RepID=UPI00193B1DCC|nr:hypothetical protein [Nocardioides sp. DJM-14]
MDLTYDHLSTDELRGTTQTDYLVALDAHFRIRDDDVTIYDEPGFPVVELARSLLIWLRDPDPGDFDFDSMSYEESGALAIRRSPSGWTFGSVFAPDAAARPVDRAEVDRCCQRFVAQVEEDLANLGLDPDEVIRR